VLQGVSFSYGLLELIYFDVISRLRQQHKVWKLQYDSSCLNVALVSNTIPLLDELCRRVMNFIYTCLHCDSNFVRSIVSHGIASGISSPIGRNAVFCSSHFNMYIANVGPTKLTGRHRLEPRTS
jgi:hypothetical protein